MGENIQGRFFGFNDGLLAQNTSLEELLIRASCTPHLFEPAGMRSIPKASPTSEGYLSALRARGEEPFGTAQPPSVFFRKFAAGDWRTIRPKFHHGYRELHLQEVQTLASKKD